MPGHIDFLDNLQACGWALESDHRTPDDVIIYADGKQLAQVRPTVFREDLRAKGWGDGLCGFRFFFPEPLSVLRQTRVSVSSVSSGELLGEKSVAPGGLLFGGGAQYPHALDCVGYAASAVRGQQDGKSLRLQGRVLAPPDTIIRFVPAEEVGSIVVHPAKSVPMPVPCIPQGAPVFSNVEFIADIQIPLQKRFVAFNLVDDNPKAAAYGRDPANPAACMCFPLTHDWLLVPDEQHFWRTCGAVTADHFITGGTTTAYQLHSLAKSFLGSTDRLSVLDWGVGCGRVAVPLKRAMNPGAEIIGMDVDRVNVDWCRAHLGDIEVSLCDFYPPLGLESDSLDMIYGISVMTHMTEAAQFVWLKELRRVLKPGGICVLTVHGEHALVQRLGQIRNPAVMLTQLGETGFSDTSRDQSLGPLDIKDYYRATFQLRRQVEEAWSRYLKIEAYYPAGLGAFQDIVVLRKQ